MSIEMHARVRVYRRRILLFSIFLLLFQNFYFFSLLRAHPTTSLASSAPPAVFASVAAVAASLLKCNPCINFIESSKPIGYTRLDIAQMSFPSFPLCKPLGVFVGVYRVFLAKDTESAHDKRNIRGFQCWFSYCRVFIKLLPNVKLDSKHSWYAYSVILVISVFYFIRA